MSVSTTRTAMNPVLLRSHSLRIPQSCRRQSSPVIIFARHESVFRRTKKRLRVKPDASFLPSEDSPEQDHIIFNPPSSAPSIYHTPLTFLPKGDQRRELFSVTQSKSSEPASDAQAPALRKPYQKQYHLTQADIDEMRRLRVEDPDAWTRGKLAHKFNCSKFFVGMVLQAGKLPGAKERHEKHLQELEDLQSRWGRRRREAREDRVRRRELWGRDE
ncbi:MAG: hypothetical protein M1823_001023 [Watsoniomyces obsoletus]|nr:MAG: hypothetical protein M1823_001023 [Watsoniomyces obsoletus]